MSGRWGVLSVRQANKKHHVSYDTILGLEDAFCEECGCKRIDASASIYRKNIALKDKGHEVTAVDNMVVESAGNYDWIFFASMGESDLLGCLPTLKEIHDKLVIYIFDSWESKWEKQERILKAIDPAVVCLAYIRAVEHFKTVLDSKVLFLPQSMDDRYYHPYNVEKSRLFMQIGRQTKALHEMTTKYLSRNHITENDDTYAHPKTWSEFLKSKDKKKTILRILKYKRQAIYAFPGTEELAKEMSGTYFFLCAPKNIDDSSKTGSISEVTARYYEAMACKTIPLGYKPKDSFDTLFPYDDAMVEVTDETFDSKVKDLLENKDKYQKIVDKNYEYVMKHHRWKNRFDDLNNEV